MENTNEEKTGIKSVTSSENKTVIEVSDLGKFTTHLEKKTEQFKSELNVIKDKEKDENPFKIGDVRLNPLHLACAKDEFRPSLRLISVKNNIATASNGSIIVKVDLTICSKLTPAMREHLNGRFIDMKVWEQMSKCDSLQLDDEYIIVNRDGINKMFEYSVPQGELFPLDNVVETVKFAGEEKKRIMCYNPGSIGIIASVFGAGTLHFSFSQGKNGTVVFPEDQCGMFAVIMPVESVSNRYMFL